MASLLLRVFADAREPRVQRASLLGRQLVVQGRSDQRVSELDAPVAELERFGLERGCESVFRSPRRRKRSLDCGRRRPRERERRQDRLAGRRRQCGQAARDELAEAARDRQLGRGVG